MSETPDKSPLCSLSTCTQIHDGHPDGNGGYLCSDCHEQYMETLAFVANIIHLENLTQATYELNTLE